jgi:hypothetical protein
LDFTHYLQLPIAMKEDMVSNGSIVEEDGISFVQEAKQRLSTIAPKIAKEILPIGYYNEIIITIIQNPIKNDSEEED